MSLDQVLMIPGVETTGATTPSDITGLLAWWDSTDSTTMLSGVVHDDATANNTGTLTGFTVNPYVADVPSTALRNVRDASGNANHGRLIGKTDAQVATDVTASGIAFDGTDDYIALSSGVSLAGEFTVALRFDAGSFATQPILGKASSATTQLRPESATVIRFRGTSTTDFTVPTMSTGTEYSLIVTRDASNNLTMYLDNVEATGGAVHSGTFAPDLIAKNSSGLFGQFNSIRDLKVFSTVFTADERLHYHTEGVSGTDPGTGDVLDMPMTDGSASTVTQTYSIDFNGSTDYVIDSAVTANSLDATDATLAAWVKVDTLDAADQLVLSAGNATPDQMAIGVSATDNLIMAVIGNTQYNSTTTISTGVWTHIAIVFDESADTYVLYVNGAKVETVSSVTATIASSLTQVAIGAISSGASGFLDGHIVQARIIASAITANQVAALVNPNITDAVTPVGHWPCDGAIEDGDNPLAYTDTESSITGYLSNCTLTYRATDDALEGTGQSTDRFDIADADDGPITFANAATGTDDSAFSVCGWVRFDAVGAGLGGIFANVGEYALHLDNSGNIVASLWDHSASGHITQTSDAALSTATWYFVACTYDGSESETGITIYVDGVAVASTGSSATYTAMDDRSNVSRFPYVNSTGVDASTRDLDGKLGSLLIYNVELSAADVALLDTYGDTYWS